MSFLFTRRFLIYFVCFFCVLCSGTQYGFSAWSPAVKTKYNMTQSSIELIGEIGNGGSFVSGPTAGMFLLVFSSTSMGLLCFVLTFVGFGSMALLLSRSTANVSALGVCFAAGSMGSCMLYTFCLSFIIWNSRKKHRGRIVAFYATLFGLSSSLFTFLFSHLLDTNVVSYFLLLAVVLAACCISAAFIVIRLPSLDDEPLSDVPSSSHHHRLSHSDDHQHVDATTAIVPLDEDDDNDNDDTENEEPAFNTLKSSASSINKQSIINTNNKSGMMSDKVALSTPLMASCATPSLHNVAANNTLEQQQRVVQAQVCNGNLFGRLFGALLFLIKNVFFWCMFSIFFLIGGAGLMSINNVGHILQSLDDVDNGVNAPLDNNYVNLLIFILSIANGSGRIIMGTSDFVPIKRGWYLVALCLVMISTHLCNAFFVTNRYHLIPSLIGIGLSYGGLNAMTPIIVSEIYGTHNFALNNGWVCISGGFASFFFNGIAGALYDDEVNRQSHTHNCVGTRCYFWAYIIAAIAATLALIISLCITPQTHYGKKEKKNLII